MSTRVQANFGAQRTDALPGLLLATSLAAVAQFISVQFGPAGWGLSNGPFSPVLIAILCGLTIGNLIKLPGWAMPGLHFARDRILKLGVILMGLQISLSMIGSIGSSALPVVISCIAAALIGVAALTRVFGVNARLGMLIAVGTSICGCTAIVATAPVIHARQSEICYAVTCVALFGTFGMLFYPLLAAMLFADSPNLAGIFFGTAIHDTSQVIGAGMVFEQSFGGTGGLESATITKLVRNLAILGVVPFLAWRTSQSTNSMVKSRTGFMALMPWFLVGFVAMSLIRTIGDLSIGAPGVEVSSSWSTFVTTGKTAAQTCLTVAMAAIGLGTSLKGLQKIGFRPFIIGILAAMLTGLVSLGAIYAFF